jgi:hypothetical protein
MLVIGWPHRCGERANRRCSVGAGPPAPQGRVPRPGSAGQTLDWPASGDTIGPLYWPDHRGVEQWQLVGLITRRRRRAATVFESIPRYRSARNARIRRQWDRRLLRERERG